jgi:hypothetical protein
VRHVLIAILILSAPSRAQADFFPFEHDVLDRQAELPCAEKWDGGDRSNDYRMTFDKQGRLATRSDGSTTTTYVTDGRGRVIMATTVSSTFGKEVVTLVRDRLGRVTRWTATRNGKQANVINSSYDAAGTKTSTLPDDPRRREVYKVVNGRVAEAISTTDSRVEWRAHYTYDASNRLVRIARDEGDLIDTEEFTYDTNGRLARETRSQTKNGVARGVPQRREYRYCTSK